MVSVKTLGILSIVTLALSPIISPIPGVLMFMATGFVYLGQRTNSPGLDIPLIHQLSAQAKTIIEEQKTPLEQITDSEKENDTIIDDQGEKIVIIEKKTLYKKEMSFDDSRKYNLTNVNCIDDCISFEAPKVKNHYDAGHKKCSVCNKWLITAETNCPCCSSRLRIKTDN